MTEMIRTKFGIIREKSDGDIAGYVNMGDKYFSIDEDDIITNYLDLGFNIIENEYLLQGGSIINHICKFRDEDGNFIEEEFETLVPPTMLMRTKLTKHI